MLGRAAHIIVLCDNCGSIVQHRLLCHGERWLTNILHPHHGAIDVVCLVSGKIHRRIRNAPLKYGNPILADFDNRRAFYGSIAHQIARRQLDRRRIALADFLVECTS